MKILALFFILFNLPLSSPAFAQTSAVCEIRYAPENDVCPYYRVYRAGRPNADCTSSLGYAIQEIQDFVRTGVCAPVQPAGSCEMTYSPENDVCAEYRVYVNGKPASNCLATQFVADQVIDMMKAANLCN